MLISLTLRIYGEHLDPDDVTATLAVHPMFARRKGDISRSSSNKEIIQKSGIWAWRSEAKFSLDEQIRELNTSFEHAFLCFSKLNYVERAVVDVCIVESESANADITTFVSMNSDSIGVLHRLGLPIEFSFYGPSDE